MSNIDYPDIIRLKQITTEIISRTCTIKDINKMLKNLNESPAVRSEIMVNSNKIRISPEETCLLRPVLDACIAHLKRDINDYNNKIQAIFDSYRREESLSDRNQPEHRNEV